MFKVVCIKNKERLSQFLIFTVNISSEGLVSALNSVGPLQGPPQGLNLSL